MRDKLNYYISLRPNFTTYFIDIKVTFGEYDIKRRNLEGIVNNIMLTNK